MRVFRIIFGMATILPCLAACAGTGSSAGAALSVKAVTPVIYLSDVSFLLPENVPAGRLMRANIRNISNEDLNRIAPYLFIFHPDQTEKYYFLQKDQKIGVSYNHNTGATATTIGYSLKMDRTYPHAQEVTAAEAAENIQVYARQSLNFKIYFCHDNRTAVKCVESKIR